MSELTKEHLYEGVKLLVESSASKIHLTQPKLYTLMSLGFQYILYLSTKNPGSYLIRLEESLLADKLMKKAKDQSTRKFLAKLMTTRKLNFGQSSLYLDYFHPQSWQMTQTVPNQKWKAALVVKGTSPKTFVDVFESENDFNMDNNLENNLEHRESETSTQNNANSINPFDENVYLAPLCELPIKVLWIAFEHNTPPHFESIKFPFIPDREESLPGGLTLTKEIKNKIF